MIIDALQPLDANIVGLPNGKEEKPVNFSRVVVGECAALFGITPIDGRGGGI